MTFEDSKRDGEDWVLTFLAPELPGFGSNQAWSWVYYDFEGKNYAIESMGGGSAYDKPGFRQTLIIKNYPYDEIWLVPDFTSRFVLSEPVVIEIK